MKKFLPLLLCLCLAGCKTNFEVPVSYTDVFQDTTKTIYATLKVETPSCKEKYLLKPTKLVTHVFPEALAVECKFDSDTLDHIMAYHIPVQVGGIGVRDCDNNQLCVASSEFGNSIEVFLGKEVRERLDFLNETNDDLNVNDLSLTINLKNDTNNLLHFVGMGVFMKDNNLVVPLVWKDLNLNPHGNVGFSLSDASTQQLIRRGTAPILFFPSKLTNKDSIPTDQRKFTETPIFE